MEGEGSGRERRRLWLALQLTVSLSLLAWLFLRGEFWADARTALAGANPGWLLGGILLAGVVQALCLLRWKIFLTMAGVVVSWREAAGVFFAGLFTGLFLPGGAGGDVVKIGLLAARGHDAALSAVSVVMDRLCGSVSMILTGVSLMWWHRDWLGQSPEVAGIRDGILVYLAVLAGLVTLSIVLCWRGIVDRWPARLPGREKLASLAGAYFRCAVEWPRSLLAVAISCVMLILYFLTFFFSARACGLEMGAGDFLAIMPAVDILAGLPVSLGGLGVREAVFVLLLGQLAGVAGGVSVTISLTGYFLSALWALPGAVLWMMGGRQR